MTLEDVVHRLGLGVLASTAPGDTAVTGGYVSDLLSDIMANARPGNLWITMQTHPNIVAVARIKELAGVVVVNGRRPEEETLRRADEERLCLLVTDDPTFRIAGRLYALLERP